MNQFTKALTVALALVAATASAQIRFPVEAPKAAIGDRIKTLHLDGLTKVQTNWAEEVVAVANPGEIQVNVKYGTGSPETFTYDGTWTRLVDVRGATEKQQRLSFPLEEGKKWTSNYKWINARGNDGRMELSFEVRGTERITVPAGTFDTVVIDGKGFWYNHSNGGSGSATEVQWYAPQAKRVVRRTWVTRTSMGGGVDQSWLYEAAEVEMKP